MKLEKVCRMCSSEKLRVRPIFKAYKQERLLAIIKDVVRIEVSDGDGLPSSICKPCATTLIRIQENLEEFRNNDRQLRDKILGSVSLAIKDEEQQSDLVQELNLAENAHQTTINEDLVENPPEIGKNDSPLDFHSDQIEHISLPDKPVAKEDFDDSGEMQNLLDCGEDHSNSAHESYDKLSDLVAKVSESAESDETEVVDTEDHLIANDYGDQAIIEEKDELVDDAVQTELETKIEAYDEPVTIYSDNDESQNFPVLQDHQDTTSDPESDAAASKPKLKPIRTTHRQHATRASTLALEKNKRARPPKYDEDDPNRPKMKDHKCYICRSESLGSAKALLEHLTTHLDRTPYTCTECKMETVIVKSVRSLNYHMRMHAQPMKCQYCDRRYCDDRARDYHVKTYHLGESAPCPSKCDECGKVCKSISALKAHIRDHKLNLRCEHCDKVFHRRGRMNDHIARVHEKTQKYECSLCGRVVHSLDSYNAHLKMHTSEKTYECDICPMKFYTAGNLGLHKKIHSSNANYKPHKDWSGHYTVSQEPGADKIYTCKLCGKSYTKTVMKINNHLKSHFKDIKCDRCERMFVNESQLKVHYVVHTGVRQHKCEHCGKDFLHKNNLTQHLRIHRNERDYACEFCGKLFTYKEGMKAHIRNHHLRDSPYKCTRCRRKFVDNASLERHITAIHEPSPVQVDLGPPPLMGTVSVPQVPNFEAIGKN